MAQIRRSLLSKPHVVYTFYDVDDWELYIGVTCNLPRRCRPHGSMPWSREAARIEWTEPMDAQAAYDLEAHLIWTLCPAWNVHRNFARRFQQPAKEPPPPGPKAR